MFHTSRSKLTFRQIVRLWPYILLAISITGLLYEAVNSR